MYRHHCIHDPFTQCSVLGPLSFLVYANNISDNLLSNSRLFSDDTSLLLCSASNINDIEGIMNHALAVVQQVKTMARII